MASENELEIDDIIEEMASLWGGITEKQAEWLKNNLEIRKFHKNAIIYKEHEVPRELMFLASGKVKIYKDVTDGRSQIMRVFKSGEFFGYRAYLAEQKYHTSAIALEDCDIAFLPIDVLLYILENNPVAGLYFMRQLAVELGKADIRTINLTQKHVRGRLAETLLFLIDNYGMDDEGRIMVDMSRADIANMSNMTTSNAIRTLSAFAEEEIIATKVRKIQVVNYDKLIKTANLG